MGQHNVFVYGSLLSGLYNHLCLEGATFLDDAQSPPDTFRMVSLGAYPAILPDRDGDPVLGEIWIVDDAGLKRLDSLEGHPHFYCREQVEFSCRSDAALSVVAWVYVITRPEEIFEYEPVPDNDWRTFKRNNPSSLRKRAKF